MPARKEDEIMAEYLLKGGKMLEKTCKTCGCPLFEFKGKTFCVVCAENIAPDKGTGNVKGTKKAAAAPSQAAATAGTRGDGTARTGGEGEMLADELALTVRTLCGRIREEKDPDVVLKLMNAVKAGTDALVILYHL
jgi:UPF0148 protein